MLLATGLQSTVWHPGVYRHNRLAAMQRQGLTRKSSAISSTQGLLRFKNSARIKSSSVARLPHSTEHELKVLGILQEDSSGKD